MSINWKLHSKTPLNVNEMKQEILWNNRFIKRDGKFIFYKAWAEKGIRKINDLLDCQGHFPSFENFQCSFRVLCTFLDYAGLLAAIPKNWKHAILASNQTVTNESLETSQSVGNVSAKLARLLLTRGLSVLCLLKLF